MHSLLTLQSEVSKARAAAEASASDATTARSEAEGLRAALRAVESRLLEYQQKDTEVSMYGEIAKDKHCWFVSFLAGHAQPWQ
jgi:hypothetical protein